jgi:hypothetical protein
MAASGCPLLVNVTRNVCVAPSSTLAGFGVKLSVTSLVTTKVPVPDFVASALLVAVTSTVAGDGRSAGAVYTPAEVIVPSVRFPPGTLLTLQLTAVSVVFVTVAVKVVWFPSRTVPLTGVTFTCIVGGGGDGGALPAPQPIVHAPSTQRAMTASVFVVDLFPLPCERDGMPSRMQARGQRREREHGLDIRGCLRRNARKETVLNQHFAETLA